MTILQQYRDLLDARLRPEPVEIPGFERGALAVRLLSDRAIGDVKLAAFQHIEKECKERGISVAALVDVDAEIYDRERVVQIVWRAYVDANDVDQDDPKQAFPTPSWIRDLDAVTVQALFDAYLAFQDTKTFRTDVSDEAIAELVAMLESETNEAALAMLGETQLRALVVILARKLRG